MKNNRTFLEKLLDGAEVEWKPLSLVTEMQRGKTITAKSANKGKIPVISGGQKPAYYHSESNRDGKTITVAGSGAYAGYIMYWEEPIFVSDAFSIKTDESLLQIKYVYHFLLQNQQKIHAMKKGSGVSHVYPKDIGTLMIPIPPLPIQTEIVKILDALTALTSELTSELTLRRKQYEYYREKLLSEEELGKVGFEWKTVKSLCNDNFWLMPATPEFDDNGNIPYITSKNIKGGKIDFQNTKYINEYVYQELSRTRCIIENDILISMIGTIGEAVIVKKEDLYFYGQNMYVLRLNNELVNHKFFLYYFTAPFILNSLLSKKNSSNQGYLKAGQIESLKIPIPPLPVQTKIVKILDKFETLTNSITEGLPLAIEQSQKRYEYYRELLLNFPGRE
jgi:COG0732: restriction endonuclease S subunits